MLVDEHNCNVLSFASELVKGVFDRGIFGLLVNDKEVLLRVWRVRHVLQIKIVSYIAA